MNHADPLDKAQAESQLMVERALASRTVYSGESSIYCHACGEQIPHARREAVKGCSLCIDCQQIEDKRAGKNAY